MIKGKQYILDITPYIPGKSNLYNQKEVIKLSSNENALGASPEAVIAYKKAANNLFRYPDGSCNKLRKTISEKYNIEEDNITFGAGSDEIISFLTTAFCDIDEEIIYSQYGFLMYPIAAKKVGAKAIMAKEMNLTANIDNILTKINNKTRIIFLANPNNPTGLYLNNQEIERLIENTPENIIIVLDLAYCEFVTNDDYPDAIKLVKKYKNVVMTRTFSKIYGLASLRLGWSYSSKYIADILNRVRGPFNICGPAIDAGAASIKDDDFVKKSIEHNQKWLSIFFDELKELNIKYYPSVANFILLNFDDVNKCQRINEILLKNGIILREMNAYNLSHCLRMTIGNDTENHKLLNILKQINK